MDKVPMTAEGYAALEAEIKHLKTVERQRIIKAITDARTHGDLSENAEYHAAKEQQGITELVGTVFKEGLVRADDIPLVLGVMGANDLPRGAKVRVQLGEVDEITLDVKGTVVERLDAEPEPVVAEEETDDEPAAGPITIAVDVTETDSDNPAP